MMGESIQKVLRGNAGEPFGDSESCGGGEYFPGIYVTVKKSLRMVL